MSRFNFCDCPTGFSAEPERHAPDCPGRSNAGKAPTPVPTTQPLDPAHARAETKCDECQGDGYYWLAGASAHPSNQHACEPCKGTGKQIAPVVGQNLRADLDRVTAERDGLQQRLNAADQRIDELGREHGEEFPPCDYCGTVPDYHPWHGAGLINGEESPHIHACTECRHKLPTSVSVASRDDSIAWLKRIDGIGQNRAELIYSMGFRRHSEPGE